MENQKQSTLEPVAAHLCQGRRVSEVLSSMGVARRNYYRWKKVERRNKVDRQSCYEVTAEERGQIDEVKAHYPQYRHRRIQGVLQQRGFYLSASVIYGHSRRVSGRRVRLEDGFATDSDEGQGAERLCARLRQGQRRKHQISKA